MLDYFDKHSACMQAQINKIMEPSDKFQDKFILPYRNTIATYPIISTFL